LAHKENDIRSTEKLLELIRKHDTVDAPPAFEPDTTPKPAATRLMPSAFRKRTIIGVDIGHTHIRLAKIVRTEKSLFLTDYLDVPFNTSISIKDDKILKPLKAALDQFSEGSSSFDIWGSIQSAKVETRCIRIPKIPRKQISNAIFWTFTKKTPLDKNSEILDYEIIGDIADGGVKKTEVLVFKAPKSDVNIFEEAFRKIGYPLTGITIVPFAIQNLLRKQIISHPGEDTCCLFVGRDWSRIAIYNKGNLILSRGIKAGMRSMVDAINSAMRRNDIWGKASSDDEFIASASHKAQPAAIDPKAQEIFFDFIGVPAASDKDTDKNEALGHDQVFQMVLPAMERLIRQIERTFEHYALNFSTEGIRRMFISGQVIANAGVVDYFERQLDIPVVPMNPFPDGKPFTEQIRIPDAVSEREGFVPAIGLALSDNAITPNFLFTHEDKDSVESVRRNNMRILTACMICLMVMIGVFSFQQKQLDRHREQVDNLNSRLIRYNPPARKELLLALFAKAKHKNKLVKQIIHRYIPAAVVTELADVTPSNIRLLNLDAEFGKPSDASSNSENSVIIEGIIFGEAGNFETMLTSYLLKLKNSPIFRKPRVQSKQIEFFHDKEVMRFVTKLEVI
jgi:type IV pilus assembly protein PilM